MDNERKYTVSEAELTALENAARAGFNLAKKVGSDEVANTASAALIVVTALREAPIVAQPGGEYKFREQGTEVPPPANSQQEHVSTVDCGGCTVAVGEKQA